MATEFKSRHNPQQGRNLEQNVHRNESFDLRRYTEYLNRCKEENLDLYWYIEAYTEINK